MPVVDDLRLGDMSKQEPVPEAVYLLRIAKTIKKTAPPSTEEPDPYPYYEVHLVVAAHENVPEEFHGRYVFDTCTTAPGKNWKLRQLCENAGADEDDNVIQMLNDNAFADREVLAAVAVEKERVVNGKKYDARNRIKKYLKADA